MAPDYELLGSFDDLLAPFHAACKPEPEWRIGTEAEKHAVLTDGSALPFYGERSVSAVLERLQDYGWKPWREEPGAPVIALLRTEGESITLEPGGQLESSGAPVRSIHATHAEMRVHIEELAPIERELGIRWLGLGFHPTASREDLPFVPKSRYPIMKQYLPTRGSRALDMMLRTCTVQANLDYDSEVDAMRKLRLALRVQPIVSAMFANSPFVEGRVAAQRSYRAWVWLDVDPDRSGLLPFAWRADSTFRDYVEWALDVPMFLIKREGRLLRNTGQTFRSFWKDGFEGERATSSDWLTHLNTLFPEVRLKKTLETRGGDAQGPALLPAHSALWKGLLYDTTAMMQIEALTEQFQHDSIAALRDELAVNPLGTTICGRNVGDWAAEVLEIATGGLARIGARDPASRDTNGRDERIYLEPLRALVERRKTPADLLVESVDPSHDLAEQLIALAPFVDAPASLPPHGESDSTGGAVLIGR